LQNLHTARGISRLFIKMSHRPVCKGELPLMVWLAPVYLEQLS
jgi:hypothetical protein